MGICIALYATLQTQVNARLDQPPVWFGLQFAAVTIANVLFQVPVGQASDRIGRRPFLLAGFVLLAPDAPAGIVTVTDPLVMTLVRLAQGSPSRACSRRRWRSRATSRGRASPARRCRCSRWGSASASRSGRSRPSGWLVGFGFVVPFAVGAALAVVALVTVVTQVEETLGAGEDAAAAATAD